jgi:hypothetical protein
LIIEFKDMDDEYITGLTGWFQGEAIPCIEDGALLKISGTYCIYTLRLTQADEKALEFIYSQLPGRSTGCLDLGFFYGLGESSPQFLTWSFEPGGIQVWGKLKPHQWKEWDETFRSLVDRAGLPRFYE